MRMNLSLRARLLLLAALAAIGMALLAGQSLLSNRIASQALDDLFEQRVRSLVTLQRIEGTLLEVRFRVAGVLLEQLPVPGSLNHLKEARAALASQWQALQPVAAQAFADTTARNAFEDMSRNWAQTDKVLAAIEAGYAAKDNAQLTAALEDQWPVLHKGVVKPLQQLIPLTQQAAADGKAQALAQSQAWLLGGMATAVLSLGLLGVMAWRTLRATLQPLQQVAGAMTALAAGRLDAPAPAPRQDELGAMIAALAELQQRLRGLVGEVRRSSDSISTASAEIAHGSQDLSHRTEQAASQLQQAASTMEQISGTASQAAASARDASQMAETAAQVAQRGGDAVARVVDTMQSIDRSARRIADITGTIDGIAFQTNILALNAAVEAARAGEHGRGFAVVAAEVRALAQRSGDAAREIKGLIGGSVDQAEQGSQLATEAGSTMQEIVQAVQRVHQVIAAISAAGGEQSSGMGQMNRSVTELDQMTQQNAALAEQSAAAAESMQTQAQHLAAVIAGFDQGGVSVGSDLRA